MSTDALRILVELEMAGCAFTLDGDEVGLSLKMTRSLLDFLKRNKVYIMDILRNDAAAAHELGVECGSYRQAHEGVEICLHCVMMPTKYLANCTGPYKGACVAASRFLAGKAAA